MTPARDGHLHRSGQCMRKGLDGREGLAGLRADATARTPAWMITYAAVVSACGMGWLTLNALQVFERVRLQALQPLMVTYTAVVCACRNGWMAVCALLFCADVFARTPARDGHTAGVSARGNG